MEYFIVPLNELKEFDPEWENRRKSNDGTKAIIHKEILDRLVPQLQTLALVEGEEPKERTYPYPLVNGEEINELPEFKSKEETL